MRLIIQIIRAAAACSIICYLVVPTGGVSHAEENNCCDAGARFDIGRGDQLILLPVTIGGHDYSFCLDTGSSHTIYDVSLRALLGKPSREGKAGWIDGVRSVQLFEAPAASIGKVPLRHTSDVVCVDLKTLPRDQGKRIYGIIGMDVLADKIVEIDFDRGSLQFLASVPEGSATPIPLQWTQLRHFRDGPFVAVNLGGAISPTIDCRVDTGWLGFETGGLRGDVFAGLVAVGDIAVVSSNERISGVAGNVERARLGRVASVSIGPFSQRSVLFIESRMSTIGLSYLSRFKVTFDFPGSVMYLEKGRQYERKDVYNLSGLHIGRRGEDIVVTRIDAGSVAEAEGIRRRDTIIQIDDTRAADAPMVELRRLLCAPGDRVVVIDRGGSRMNVTLHLEEAIKAINK